MYMVRWPIPMCKVTTTPVFKTLKAPKAETFTQRTNNPAAICSICQYPMLTVQDATITLTQAGVWQML
jgi:hypothetical protein